MRLTKTQALALIRAIGYFSTADESLEDAVANLQYFVLHGAEPHVYDNEEDQEAYIEEADKPKITEVENEEGYEEESSFGGEGPESQEEVARGNATTIMNLEMSWEETLALHKLLSCTDSLPDALIHVMVRTQDVLTDEVSKNFTNSQQARSSDVWFSQQEEKLRVHAEQAVLKDRLRQAGIPIADVARVIGAFAGEKAADAFLQHSIVNRVSVQG